MRAALLALAVLAAACRPDPRAESCETVRQILDRHDPSGPADMPRRYYDYEPHVTESFDPDVARDLQKQRYMDPEVQAAVRAVGDTSWTIYTPYSAEATVPLNHLRELCHLPGRVTVE